MTARKKRTLALLGAVAYLIIGVFAISSVTRQVTDQYYDLLATKALDIAKMAAVDYVITDQEVLELKQLDFKDVLNHPANTRLRAIFARGNFSEDIKYAYIMVKLDPADVRYYVTEENTDWYHLPAGTPLNLLWLTDTIINPFQQKLVNQTVDYYDDNNRYSYMYESDLAVYDQRKSSFVISEDEYGSAFSGLTPVYTVEGNYVGLLGVDIYYENFVRFTQNICLFLLAIFMLPTIILTVAYMIFYLYESQKNNTVANTDPLTSLYNRRYLDVAFKHMAIECAQKKNPLSVVMIDLDYFKNYNDSYGHQVGDQALIAISKAISSSLRRKTDIVCRYGGEELIILLPNTDVLGAIMVAEKIEVAIASLELPHCTNSVSNCVTVSQGIFAGIPVAGEEACFVSDSISKADQALYKAKANGRNRFEVYSGASANIEANV